MSLAARRRDEDFLYEEQRQREVDAEQEGRRAGRLGLGAGLSSNYHGRELKAWMLGFNEESARLAADAIKTRRSCIGCDCRGKAACVGDTQ